MQRTATLTEVQHNGDIVQILEVQTPNELTNPKCDRGLAEQMPMAIPAEGTKSGFSTVTRAVETSPANPKEMQEVTAYLQIYTVRMIVLSTNSAPEKRGIDLSEEIEPTSYPSRER